MTIDQRLHWRSWHFGPGSGIVADSLLFGSARDTAHLADVGNIHQWCDVRRVAGGLDMWYL